jgi:transglutaminase-like putative cysteine protease
MLYALLTGLLAFATKEGQAEIEDRLHTLLEATKATHSSMADDVASSDSGGGLLEDNWYVVQMGTSGQVVGRMHTSVTEADGLYESTEELEVVLQRGADRSAMFIETEVIEDSEGRVRMQRLAHQMGATMTTSVRYVWNDDGTVSVTSSSGRGSATIDRVEPAPDSSRVVGRFASEQAFKRRAAKGESPVDLVTLRPEFGLEEVKMTRRLVNTSALRLDVCGTRADVLTAEVWHTVIEGVPMNMTELYADLSSEQADRSSNRATARRKPLSALTLVQSTMDSPFGPLVCTLCNGKGSDDALAASTADKVLASNAPLPEIVYSVAVPLPGAIPGMGWPGSPRCIFKVRHSAGMPLSLPSSGYQRARRKKKLAPLTEHDKDNLTQEELEQAETDAAEYARKRASEVRVIVDVNAPPKEATESELADAAYRSPTAMVDSDDEKIKALAESITSKLSAKQAKDTLSRAQALRAGARQHITHSTLATGFASASETVRSQQGDCTEHAMLLAALLRADGIPSRVCTGVVYSESSAVQASADPHQTMGGGTTQAASLVWHMWSQALIDGAWHDLDATLDLHFHGGHILTSTSSMVDILSLRSSELQMMKLIGALDVTVQEVSQQGADAMQAREELMERYKQGL